MPTDHPSQPLRILIPADTYYPHVNGASYFAQRLAEYLTKRGHEVLVIAPSRTAHTESYMHNGVSIFGIRSLPVVFYKDFRFANPVLIKKEVKKIVEEFRPDVAHLQGHYQLISKMVLEIAQDLHIPTVGTNHFMPENLVHYLHLPHRIRTSIVELGWKQCCRVFEQMDIVTSPTKTAAEMLRQNGFSKPVHAISCGIDLERFHPGYDTSAIRERYRLPANTPLLLYVGRLDREKNIDLVIRAVAKTVKQTPVHFLIAGKGAQQENLQSLASELGIEHHVTFAGFVPDEDLPALYCTADCFVIAGIAELQSIVTMEAMASGLPVLAVDAVALPELVQDGDNGYLFPPDDVRQLSEKLMHVMSQPEVRKKMGLRSLERIQTHSIDRSIAAFEQLYLSLLPVAVSKNEGV